MNSKFRKLMYVLLSAVILITAFFIAREKQQSYEEKKLLEVLQEEQRKEEENIKEKIQNNEKENDQKGKEEQKNKEENVEQKEILPQYKSLYERNEDFYGWIKTEDFGMDFPVMYTPQEGRENFYVYQNFEKEYSKSGSIYIDYRCRQEGNNYLIYGHNMSDLSMFGYLSYYKEETFCKNNKYIKFDTIYEEGEYEIIAVSKAFIKKEDLEDPSTRTNSKVPYKEVSDEDYLFYNHVILSNEQEFNNYIKYMKEHSYYEIEANAQYGDKLITLCTCTNIKQWQNERLLIVAKKIK